MSIHALLKKSAREVETTLSSVGWCVGESLFDIETDLCDMSEFPNGPIYRGIGDPGKLPPHYYRALIGEYFDRRVFREVVFHTPPGGGGGNI